MFFFLVYFNFSLNKDISAFKVLLLELELPQSYTKLKSSDKIPEQNKPWPTPWKRKKSSSLI